MNTYREKVLRYRVMRQMNDPERNPSGAWSLVYSTSVMQNALDEMVHQVQSWGTLGDSFKIVDSGVAESFIERLLY